MGAPRASRDARETPRTFPGTPLEASIGAMGALKNIEKTLVFIIFSAMGSCGGDSRDTSEVSFGVRGPSGDHSEAMCRSKGASRDPLEQPRGASGRLGKPWGGLGGTVSSCWEFGDALATLFGILWASCESLVGSLWGLGTLGGSIGTSGEVWGRSWRLWGGSGEPWGCSGRALGDVWGALWVLLGRLWGLMLLWLRFGGDLGAQSSCGSCLVRFGRPAEARNLTPVNPG